MHISLFRRLQRANASRCRPDCRGWLPWLDGHSCAAGESASARPCGFCWRHYPRADWPSDRDATEAYLRDLALRQYAEPARRLVLPALLAAGGDVPRAAHALGLRLEPLYRIVRAHPQLLRAKLTLELDAQEARQDATDYDIGC